MTTLTADPLPISETLAPETQSALAQAIAEAAAAGTAVYPIGGGTSLDYGLRPTRPGAGVSLARLNRVIDYPARDLTITVEAGVTLGELAATLAAERQWLPVDAPLPDRATLGGAVATGWSGPRRFGYGTLRDYVIGITAVDGRGVPFRAGGRVVKNVAGYDFCKLLTGSLGTLGVIAQVSLKIRPLPEESAFLIADVSDLDEAERLLAALVTSATTPAAIELINGSAWRESAVLGISPAGTSARLVVGLEGTEGEVDWMLAELDREWQSLGVQRSRAIGGEDAATLWRDLIEYPSMPGSPLVVKASVPAGRTTEYMALVRELDADASIQAHAGSGIVTIRLGRFEPEDISRVLVGCLQAEAERLGGHVVVLSSALDGLTRRAIWGCPPAGAAWMARLKQQFDPSGILNPGRAAFE